MEEIREKLLLDVGVWVDLPDELISLAFKQESFPNIKREYKVDNRQLYEFFGDSVLQLLVSKILLETEKGPDLTPGTATEGRSLLVRNSTLKCLLDMKGLCYDSGDKYYADCFEALIGIMYWWALKNVENPLEKIEQWLEDNFQYVGLAKLITEGSTDPCSDIKKKRKKSTRKRSPRRSPPRPPRPAGAIRVPR